MEPDPTEPVVNGTGSEDERIVAAMRRGDQQAWGMLYEAYSDRMYSYAYSLTGDIHAAADIAQETVLIAIDQIQQLRDPKCLRPWMYAICRSRCHSLFRSGARVVSAEGQLDQRLAGGAADLATSDDPTSAREAQELVSAALAGLSSTDREIIELAIRHDLDVADIARAMGSTPDATRAKLSRARSQLGQAIEALVLFRSRDVDCTELRQLQAVPDFTALVRKRIARHARKCSVCGPEQRKTARSVAIVTIPLLLIPAGLRAGHAPAGPDSLVAATAPSSSGLAMVRFDANGWPALASRATRKAAVLVGAGVAAAGLVVAALVAIPAVTDSTDPSRAAASTNSLSAESLPRATNSVDERQSRERAAQRDSSPSASARPDPSRSRAASQPTGTPVLVGQPRPAVPAPATARPVKNKPNRPSRHRPTTTAPSTNPATPPSSAPPAPPPSSAPPDDCWRYDPGAGEDYLPGGAPPECESP